MASPAWAAGDRVYVAAFMAKSGTYAERIACDARTVHRLPAGVSFGQGAALGVPAATAYRALVLRAQVKAGETVLVHGASGAVGIAAVQLARGMGLRVFGTAGSDAGAAAAESRRPRSVRSRPGRLRDRITRGRRRGLASTSSSRCWPTSTSIAT